jgi:hypothetical protein
MSSINLFDSEPASEPASEPVDQLELLFGKPPLLEGEDEERYLRLRKAVAEHLKPETTFDWIDVRDHVDKIWEEERYKLSSAALINRGLKQAVSFYLLQIDQTIQSVKFARGDAKDKAEVLEKLAEHGITLTDLQAKAAQLEGPSLAMFDRMVAAREAGRRMLRKESEQRRNPTVKS